MSDEYSYPRTVFSRVTELGDAPEIRSAYLQIIEVVFFASMMAEEGEQVSIGVVVEVGDRLEDVRDGDGAKSWLVWRIDAINFDARNLKRLAHGIQYGRDLAVVTVQGSRLFLTGVARREMFTDGGSVLRIAAPNPGSLVLEGKNGQIGVRYEAGRELARDIAVIEEEGPVLAALRACQLDEYCMMLVEIIRHARASRAGAMFLCLPATGIVDSWRDRIAYRFVDSAAMARLVSRERTLFARTSVRAVYRALHTNAEIVEQFDRDMEELEELRAHRAAYVEMVGRLAANDGAVVIEPGFSVVGAGFIIGDMPVESGAARPPVPKECLDVAGKTKIERAQSGGARHAAGFRFAWAVHNAVVFIVSADGPVTCVIRCGDELLTWPVNLPET